VVDLATEERVVLMDEAVLAEEFGTESHQPPEVGADITGAHEVSFR
jgi:hypothetical protein